MALELEGVVDGGMDGQESLGRAGRFEPLELPLAPPRQMRILRAIVHSQSLLVPLAQADVPECRRVDANVRRGEAADVDAVSQMPIRTSGPNAGLSHRSGRALARREALPHLGSSR